MAKDSGVKIHFSQYFRISPEALEEYGAFNISLINDLPFRVACRILHESQHGEQIESLLK